MFAHFLNAEHGGQESGILSGNRVRCICHLLSQPPHLPFHLANYECPHMQLVAAGELVVYTPVLIGGICVVYRDHPIQ